MRILYMMFLSVAVSLTGAFAQKNVLRGSILDENQKPVIGASVFLEGTVRGVQTDASGYYIIKDFPKGD
jgi:Fe(3+) dicitrate transport protein